MFTKSHPMGKKKEKLLKSKPQLILDGYSLITSDVFSAAHDFDLESQSQKKLENA